MYTWKKYVHIFFPNMKGKTLGGDDCYYKHGYKKCKGKLKRG